MTYTRTRYLVTLTRPRVDYADGGSNPEPVDPDQVADDIAAILSNDPDYDDCEVEPAAHTLVQSLLDRETLDRLAWLLSAPEWPGASGMEDVAELVARTGRDLHQEGAQWYRH